MGMFTYLWDPNGNHMLHDELRPLAGTCSQLRTWVKEKATQDITQSLSKYRDLFNQIHQGFDSESPIFAQATAAKKLVYYLFQEHGISGFRYDEDQTLRVLTDITNVKHISTHIRINRHFPFRLLSLKEVILFHNQMMQTWNVETLAKVRTQWQAFAAKKMEPHELTQLELLLDLASYKHEFSQVDFHHVINILERNPEALLSMLRTRIQAKRNSEGYTFYHFLASRDMAFALEETARTSLKNDLFLRNPQGMNIVAVAASVSALKTIFWSLKHADPKIRALSLNLFPDMCLGVSVAHVAAQYGRVKVLEALSKDPKERALLLQKDAADRTIWDHAARKTTLNSESVLAWIRETQLVKHLAPANTSAAHTAAAENS